MYKSQKLRQQESAGQEDPFAHPGERPLERRNHDWQRLWSTYRKGEYFPENSQLQQTWP